MSLPVPRRSATVWACDDEVCDCCQAIVEDIERHPKFGPPYVQRTRVAEGPFYTDGEGWIDGRVHIDRDHLALLYGDSNQDRDPASSREGGDE